MVDEANQRRQCNSWDLCELGGDAGFFVKEFYSAKGAKKRKGRGGPLGCARGPVITHSKNNLGYARSWKTAFLQINHSGATYSVLNVYKRLGTIKRNMTFEIGRVNICIP